jgi:hypothetical protein
MWRITPAVFGPVCSAQRTRRCGVLAMVARHVFALGAVPPLLPNWKP